MRLSRRSTLAVRIASALVAALIPLGLAAACSQPGDPTAKSATQPAPGRPRDLVRKEFTDFEASGADLAQLASAIHSSEPELYDKLIDIAASPSWKGTPQDAMLVIRPLYLAAFTQKLPAASDTDIVDLVDILIKLHTSLLATAPLLCAKGEKADPSETAKFVAPELLQRENQLQARVVRLADPSAPRATQGEIEEWKAKHFKGTEPRLQGSQYFQVTDPTTEQARAICDAELFILQWIAREKPERQAYLYRGLMAPR